MPEAKKLFDDDYAVPPFMMNDKTEQEPDKEVIKDFTQNSSLEILEAIDEASAGVKVHKIDAKFVLDEVGNHITNMMNAVAESFVDTDDKGTVVVKINMKQKNKNGDIHLDFEVSSKGAPKKSVSYVANMEHGRLVYQQTKMDVEGV